MNRETVFSPCRLFRYTLWREWNTLLSAGPSYAQFVCLNPSTADENLDDPTVRRCVNFSKAWGFDAFVMTNLFAVRSTDPSILYNPRISPIGEENDAWLLKIAREAAIVICAWGNHGQHLNRGMQVKSLLTDNGIKLHCLGVTSEGQPKHPLYLSKDSKPIPFQ